MPLANIGVRLTTHDIADDTRQRRIDLFEKGLLLEPDATPTLAYLAGIKAEKGGKGIDTTVIEWFEDRFLERWVTNGGAGALSTDTTINVAAGKGPLAIPGSVVMIPKAITSSAQPELIQVTAVSGDAWTVTRGFGGTTAAAIAAGASMYVMHPLFAENTGAAKSQTTIPVKKLSYLAIFKRAVEVSGSKLAVKNWANSGMPYRDFQTMKMMQEIRKDMNHAFLFGVAMEDTATAQRMTKGLNASVTANIFDMGGTLTKNGFFGIMSNVFRYGSKEKIMFAAPIYIDALDRWVRDATYPIKWETGVRYGVSVMSIESSHGVLKVVKDNVLANPPAGTNGMHGLAYIVDPMNVNVYHLEGGGVNRNLHVIRDSIKDGKDGITDQIIAEVGTQYLQDETHAKLFNASAIG